ncbi:tetratricopeptide repeat protein [Kitasatospora sp. NPDC056184]|uniref:tetratricopeptide repeat protein n=1 Tax=Kitasatospora sp. NPDC056184 TaxID=3345738 RepID=UPI0035DFBAC3
MDVFVGRTQEQERFRLLLRGLGRPDEGPDEGHVLLVRGLGGIGKSTLLRRYEQIARGQSAEDAANGKRLRVASLDWEQGQLRSGGASAEGPPLWRVLGAVQVQVQQATGRRGERAFERFRGCVVRMPALAARARELGLIGGGAPVATASAEELQQDMGGATGAAGALSALGIQVAGDVVAQGVNGAAAARNTGRRALHGNVDSRLFQELIDDVQAMLDAFAQGMRQVSSRRHPVVVLLDTCELLGDALNGLREVMKASGRQVLWVLGIRLEEDTQAAGDSHAVAFARYLDHWRLRHEALARFDDRSVAAYLRQRPRVPDLDDDQVKRIAEFTRGVPLAVSLTADALTDGMDLDRVLVPFTGDGTVSGIIRELARRYLVHTRTVPALRPDRQHLCALALMRPAVSEELFDGTLTGRDRDDPGVLAALCGIPERDVTSHIDRLAARHDFLLSLPRILHQDVRDTLRTLLLSADERARVRDANQRAADHLRARAAARGLTTVDAQLEDHNWRQDVLSLLWHTYWTDQAAGQDLLLHLLPAAVLHDAFNRQLQDIAAFFNPTAAPTERALLATLRKLLYLWPFCPSSPEQQAARLAVDRLARHTGSAPPVLADQPPAHTYHHLLRASVHKHLGTTLLQAVTALRQAAGHAPPDDGLTAAAIGSTAEGLIDTAEDLTPEDFDDLLKADDEAFVEALRLHCRYQPDGDGYIILGNVLAHHLERYGEAEAVFHQALDHDPDNSQAHADLGFFLLLLGRGEEADTAFRRALHHDPDNAEAHLALGGILHEAGRLAEAEAAYRRGLRHRHKLEHGALAYALTALGDLLSTVGRPEEAEAAYRQALHYAPDGGPHPHDSIGAALAERWKREETEAVCRQLLQDDPDNAKIHTSLGNALVGLGRREEAAAAFRQALVHNPDSANAQLGLGLMLLLTQGYGAATEAQLREAVRCAPRSVDAHLLLGRVLMVGGRVEEAREAWAIVADDDRIGAWELLLTAATCQDDDVRDYLYRTVLTITQDEESAGDTGSAFHVAECRAVALAGRGQGREGAEVLRATVAARTSAMLFDRPAYELFAAAMAPGALAEIVAVWEAIIAADPLASGPPVRGAAKGD